MHQTNQPQTTSSSQERDAAIQITSKTKRTADFILNALLDDIPPDQLHHLAPEWRGELCFFEALSKLSEITACLLSNDPRQRMHGQKLMQNTLKKRRALLSAQEDQQ